MSEKSSLTSPYEDAHFGCRSVQDATTSIGERSRTEAGGGKLPVGRGG